MCHNTWACRFFIAEGREYSPQLIGYLRAHGIQAAEVAEEDRLAAWTARGPGRALCLLEVLTPRFDTRRFLRDLADWLPGLPLTWGVACADTAAVIVIRKDGPTAPHCPHLDFLEVVLLIRKCSALTEGRLAPTEDEPPVNPAVPAPVARGPGGQDPVPVRC